MLNTSEGRTFALSRIDYAGQSFLMESFTNPWGCDDPIIAEIYRTQAYDEMETLALWTFAIESAEPNSLALDVGAYAGLFSLIATSTRRDARAVAFEPSTMTFGRLARNIQWNNLDTRVIPVNLAASNALGILSLPHAWGVYSMSPGERFEQPNIDHTQPVTAVPLDALLEPRERRPHYLNSKSITIDPLTNISAIKIDVEGQESVVMQGGLQLIRKFRPIIVAEFWNAAAILSIEAVLTPEGYRAERIGNERNILCVPEERSNWRGKYAAWKESCGLCFSIGAKPIFTFHI